MSKQMDAPWERCSTGKHDWQIRLQCNASGYIFQYEQNPSDHRWCVTVAVGMEPDGYPVWCSTWRKAKEAAELLVLRDALGVL